MPSDITGTEILQLDNSTGSRELRFIKGPIFANLILADEINRTPPKTQAALLEAMQEYTVTSSGTTHQLEQPFFVAATQNPIEQEGTYPLPEAQLDRFMFSIDIGYPDEEEELTIVEQTTTDSDSQISSVFTKEEVMAYQDLVRRIPASRHVIKYAVALTRATRPNEKSADVYIRDYVEWGAGPRASQSLILAAKTLALFKGKASPSTAEVREAALPVLSHRIIPNYNATGEGITTPVIISKLLSSVKEPDYSQA